MNCNKASDNYDANYDNIKLNVDNLKIIQLGITLADDQGYFPENTSSWQFNFKFDLTRDIYLDESISLLSMSGIDFNKFMNDGIDIDYFGENIISSGVILNDNINWITFHGVYDFAYLLKSVSNLPLPDDEKTFLDILNIYFPNFYDVRVLVKNLSWLKGSLSKISGDLDLKRVGQCHQGGSDSLITSKLYFKLIYNYPDLINLNACKNKLYGLNSSSLGSRIEDENFISEGVGNIWQPYINGNNYKSSSFSYNPNQNIINNNLMYGHHNVNNYPLNFPVHNNYEYAPSTNYFYPNYFNLNKK